MQMKVIKRCLDEFAEASGQLINLEKIKLFFSSNFDKAETSRISMGAGIPIIEDLGKYL